MKRSLSGVAIALLAVLGAVPVIMSAWPGDDSTAGPVSSPALSAADEARARSALANLPLSFEANHGQDDPSVAFTSRGAAYDLFLTPTEAVFALPGQAENARGATLRMSLVGANPDPAIAGREQLAGKVNYFRGNDPEQWQRGVPTYGQVAYDRVYPGIDLVYYGRGQELEYDFVVAPGADPGPIALEFSGADEMRIDAGGDLVLDTPAGELRQRRPEIYQDIDGTRRPVPGRFVLGPGGTVGFDLGPYDTAHPLVIDPVVTYSTYFGFASSVIQGVAVDETGIYVAGEAFEGAIQGTAGAYQPQNRGGTVTGPDGRTTDAFVAKINLSGSELLYATHLGGAVGAEEFATTLDVDGNGNAYVGGQAEAAFPQVNGYAPCSPSKIFLSKLDSTGSSLLYSTCVAGAACCLVDLVVNDSGSAYVTGVAGSGFAASPDALQPQMSRGDALGGADGFLVRIDTLSSGGESLDYATFFGSEGADTIDGLTLADENSVWITGETSSRAGFVTDGSSPPDPENCTEVAFCADAYVARINTGIDGADGLELATYFGGTLPDNGAAVAVGPDGSIYLAGTTFSNGLATQKAFQPAISSQIAPNRDLFVARLQPDGRTSDYVTYLGGIGDDGGTGNIAIVPGTEVGEVTVVAPSSSEEMSVKKAFQPQPGGGGDLLIATFDTFAANEESLTYSSWLGGSGIEGFYRLAAAGDEGGKVYIGTSTSSGDYVTTPAESQFGAAGSLRGLLVEISPEPERPPFDVVGMTPGRGPAGTPITIAGSGFAEGVEVRFGDNPATDVTVPGPDSLSLTVPPRGTEGPEVEVRVTLGEEERLAGTFTYLEPSITGVDVGECRGLSRSRQVTISGTNLDLVGQVFLDGQQEQGQFQQSATELTIPSFSGNPAGGTVDVRVVSVDGTEATGSDAYEACDDSTGGEDPPDPPDPAPGNPRGGNTNTPPFQTPGGSPGSGQAPTGGFSPDPVTAPGGGFTTDPGPATAPGGGFTTAPGTTGAPAGGPVPSGGTSAPAGGFSTAPQVSPGVPNPGFTTAPGASGAPTGGFAPGATPAPGGSSAPSAGANAPPPGPGPGAAPAPVAPAGGGAPSGAPALGGMGEERGASGASRYSMVAADRAPSVPPVAVAGAALLLVFACALVATSPALRPGWQVGGLRSRPDPRARY